MIKQNKWSILLSSIIIALPTIFGLIVWDRLPDQIATHWGPSGEPDGWSSRAFTVFFIPLFLLAVHWLGLFVTAKDPKNDGHNRRMLWLVLWIAPALSLLVNALIYTTAFGVSASVERVAPLVVGLLFMVIGNYMPKFKQNYTIGIKITWTLHSEENWNATHRFAGKVWMLGGLFLMICGLIPSNAVVWVSLSAIALLVIVPFLYSYFYYRKHG